MDTQRPAIPKNLIAEFQAFQISPRSQRITMKKRKLLQKLLSGSKNIRFSEASSCAVAFGFRLSRTAGAHHIYTHPEVPELLNLQDVGGKAKPIRLSSYYRS